MGKGLTVIHQRTGAQILVPITEYEKEVSRLTNAEGLTNSDAQGVTEAKYINKYSEMLQAYSKRVSPNLKALRKAISLSNLGGSLGVDGLKESIDRISLGKADAFDIEILSMFLSRIKHEHIKLHGDFDVQPVVVQTLKFFDDFSNLKFDENGNFQS